MSPEQLASYKNIKLIEAPSDFARSFYLEPEFITIPDHKYKTSDFQKDLITSLIQLQNITSPQDKLRAELAVIKGTEDLGVGKCQHKNCNLPFNLHFPNLVVQFKNADLLIDKEIEQVIQNFHIQHEQILTKHCIFGAMIYGVFNGTDLTNISISQN